MGCDDVDGDMGGRKRMRKTEWKAVEGLCMGSAVGRAEE